MELGASLGDDGTAGKSNLIRNTDGHAGTAWISAIVQVIPVVAVYDVNIIGLVPVVSPKFRIWVNNSEPIATVLEAWKSAYFHEREAVDTKRVI